MSSFLQNVERWKEILGKLEFEIQPMAIKYCARVPTGVGRLDRRLAFCEMIRYAQLGNAFYARNEDHTCPVGPFVLGGPNPGSAFETGLFGAVIGATENPRSMRRHYDRLPRLAEGTIECAAFSPLDKLMFEPDLLVLVADKIEQTDIVIRALTYKSGDIYESKSTYVLACAWNFIYPYLSGKWNYVTTGLSMGMGIRKVLRSGLQIVSIPYDKLPALLDGLEDMPWVLPVYGDDPKKVHDRISAELGLPGEPPPYFWSNSAAG